MFRFKVDNIKDNKGLDHNFNRFQSSTRLIHAAVLNFHGKNIITSNSPGYNHFWVLDDVTNMDVVVGHRGNSLVTLFEP